MTDEKADERYYKVGEVEKMLSVSKTTMKRWIKDKKIRAVKFGPDVEGSPWRISESAIAEFKEKYSRYNTDEPDSQS